MHILKKRLFGTLPASKSFTKDDGTVITPKGKLVLVDEITFKNGSTKTQLLELSIDEEKRKQYESKIGSIVEVVVNVRSDSRISYFAV